MKATLQIFAAFVALSILVGCTSVAVDSHNLEPILPESEATEVSEITLSEADEVREVQWISLTFESPDNTYCIAREVIREHLEIDDTVAGWIVPTSIAIEFYDLNGDGYDEIIALITGAGWVGSRNTGPLYVFRYRDESIIGSRNIGGTMLMIDYLGDPSLQQIGIIRNENGWDYIYQNGRIRQTYPFRSAGTAFVMPQQAPHWPNNITYDTPPTVENFPPIQRPSLPEPAPRAAGTAFVMPQQAEGELAEKMLDFVHTFSHTGFVFPEFASVTQMDFENPSVSSNLLGATRRDIVTIYDMTLEGRKFFGDEFEFPRGVETWDMFGEYVDGIYSYSFWGRGGLDPWRYLILDYVVDGDSIVAIFFPFNPSADWYDGAIDHVVFLYQYDMSNVATSRAFFDVKEGIVYLKERVLPGFDGHILDYVLLHVPQEELGTITVTFRGVADGSLIAVSSRHN